MFTECFSAYGSNQVSLQHPETILTRKLTVDRECTHTVAARSVRKCSCCLRHKPDIHQLPKNASSKTCENRKLCLRRSEEVNLKTVPEEPVT